MMTQLAPGMPPLPPRFMKLPLDHRGYPVPKFCHQRPDGTYDFRVVKQGWPEACRKRRLCWLCGEPLGKFMCFVIGPMCALNRNTAEPPCHRECAEFAVMACPFMRYPNRKRDREDLPADGHAPGGKDAMILRNPGVTCLWITKSYRAYRSQMNGDVLIEIGDPIEVQWWAHGRSATRQEIMGSINSGLPILRAMAEKEGQKAVEHLNYVTERGLKLVPA
jgi:hypothetical protein